VVTPVSLDEALTADVIIVAIPFLAVRELGFSRSDWSGKIVVDSTNAFTLPNADEVLNGRLSTDFNAEAFPGAAVVKAFNQTAVKQFTEKRPPEFGRRVVFVASNSPAASAAVADLANQLGFAPIQLGRIDEGGVLIQARNALTLRNLYELPINLGRTTTVTPAGVDNQLKPGTWAIDHSTHRSPSLFATSWWVRYEADSRSSPDLSRCPTTVFPLCRRPLTSDLLTRATRTAISTFEQQTSSTSRTSPPRPSRRPDYAKTTTSTRWTATSPCVVSPSRSQLVLSSSA
jgi:predicted dinucleotide-binding enzyme